MCEQSYFCWKLFMSNHRTPFGVTSMNKQWTERKTNFVVDIVNHLNLNSSHTQCIVAYWPLFGPFLIRSTIENFFFSYHFALWKKTAVLINSTVYAIMFTFDWMHWIDTYPKISQLVKQTNKTSVKWYPPYEIHADGIRSRYFSWRFFFSFLRLSS